MKTAIFQAPNGKWFFKLYNEEGSVVFNSGEIFASQIEANEALEAKLEEETGEAKPKKAKKEPKVK